VPEEKIYRCLTKAPAAEGTKPLTSHNYRCSVRDLTNAFVSFSDKKIKLKAKKEEYEKKRKDELVS
jgi:hypothetical protein